MLPLGGVPRRELNPDSSRVRLQQMGLHGQVPGCIGVRVGFVVFCSLERDNCQLGYRSSSASPRCPQRSVQI